jgi:hypothetical protein
MRYGLMLAACEMLLWMSGSTLAAEITCSGDKTLEILQKLVDAKETDNLNAIARADDRIMKRDPSLFVPSTATIEDIISVEQTDRAADCKATLVLHGHEDLLSENNIRLEYTVEMTDAGKLHVTASEFSRNGREISLN